MTARDDLPNEINTALRWPLFLTRLGMGAETIVRAFWPFWSVIFAVLAFLMLGLQDYLPVEAVWTVIGISGLGALWAFCAWCAPLFVANASIGPCAPGCDAARQSDSGLHGQSGHWRG